jgi:hypothetical protein
MERTQLSRFVPHMAKRSDYLLRAAPCSTSEWRFHVETAGEFSFYACLAVVALGTSDGLVVIIGGISNNAARLFRSLLSVRLTVARHTLSSRRHINRMPLSDWRPMSPLISKVMYEICDVQVTKQLPKQQVHRRSVPAFGALAFTRGCGDQLPRLWCHVVAHDPCCRTSRAETPLQFMRNNASTTSEYCRLVCSSP